MLSLIWEPVIFFTPFFLIPLIFKYSIYEKLKLLKLFPFFLPFILISLFIALNPISDENHLKMAKALANNFGEKCYMSCALLKSKSGIIDQFTYNVPHYSIEIIIRYFSSSSTKEYFYESWNIFDLSIVLISLIPESLFSDTSTLDPAIKSSKFLLDNFP